MPISALLVRRKSRPSERSDHDSNEMVVASKEDLQALVRTLLGTKGSVAKEGWKKAEGSLQTNDELSSHDSESSEAFW